MTVKELIKKLKTLPQNLEAGMALFDQPMWMACDWVETVEHIVKSEHSSFEDERMYAHLPDEYVIIHGETNEKDM